jgi:hypothetical protein
VNPAKGAATPVAKFCPLSTHALRLNLKLDSDTLFAVETITVGSRFILKFVRDHCHESLECKLGQADLREGMFKKVKILNLHDYEIIHIIPELGMFVREVKDYWKQCVLYACSRELYESFEMNSIHSLADQSSMQPPQVLLTRYAVTKRASMVFL